MRRMTYAALACVLAALWLLTGCEDSAGTADTDGDDAGRFGAACTANANCDSGMCVGSTTTTPGFCSAPCSTDGDCQQILFGACCETRGGYCKTSDLCGGLDGDLPDGDGDEPVLCTPESFRCIGSDLQRCNATGDWELYRDCAAAGMTCVGDSCVPAADGDLPGDCTAGERRCNGTDFVERCNTNLVWERFQECSLRQTCEDGACVTPLGDPCTVEEGCADDGEYCLPSRAGGSTGNCMPYCDVGNTGCPRGWECSQGQCQPIRGYCLSSADCASEEFCDRLPTNEDGRCLRYCNLPGENCPELYRCITDRNDPNYGRCILEDPTCHICSYDGECAMGSYCEIIAGQAKGCCKPSCSSDADCPGILTCDRDGRCVVGSGGGDCGGSCPQGYICDRTFNQCVLNCPGCGVNQCCDAQSAPSCYTCECQNPVVCGILLPPCCFGYNCSAMVYGVLGYCI